MSDTEDTEELEINNSISLNKKQIIIENTINKKEEKITSIIEIISELFINICEENKEKKCNKNFLLKSFTNKFIPSISIKDFLFRLSKYSRVNESTIILILIYIDRICNLNNFIITYYNIHKLILASFILSIKYNEENYYSMIFYSKIGGVSLSELNNLEYEYLILIKYNLFIQPKLFYKYYNDLMSLKYNNDDESENEDEEEDKADLVEEERNEKINNYILNSSEIDTQKLENNNINSLEKEVIRV